MKQNNKGYVQIGTKHIAMKKIYTIIAALFLYSTYSFSATFTSVLTGSWTTPATWGTPTAPTAADDAVISAGTNVTVPTPGGSDITNVTINAGGTLTITGYLQVFGTLNNMLGAPGGTLAGTNTIVFTGAGTKVTSGGAGTATWPHTGRFYFTGVQTIDATVTITNKAGEFVLYNLAPGVNVTNNGNITLSVGFLTNNGATACTWTQGVSSTLSVPDALPAIITLNASAASNTVTFAGTSSYTITAPSPSFYNLTLSGSGVKTIPTAITITNNITISSPIDISSATFSVGGNWTNTGFAITQNIGTTVSFNTAAVRTIAKTTGTETIFNANFTGGTTNLGGAFQFASVSISGGATLDVTASNYAISLSRNWTNSGGTFNAQGGTVTFNSGGVQSIGGTAATTFNNISATNGLSQVTVTSAQNLAGILTLGSGNSFATGTNVFTLLSNSATNKTGQLAALPSGAVLTGTRWVVQRFVPASTANWDDLSSPLTNSDISDWDNELYLSMDPSCPDGMAQPVFQSAYYYTEITSSFTAITSCAEPLVNTRGFEIWLGTDIASMAATTFNTGLQVGGTPATGDRAATVTRTGANGWNLIGNPYPAAIDWDLVFLNAVSLDNLVQIYDQTINDYALYDGASPALSTGQLFGSGGVLSSTQGFWVHSTSGAPSLTFRETHKSPTTTRPFVRGNPNYYADNCIHMFLRTEMMKNACESVINFIDGASADADEHDAPYMRSPDKKTPSFNPLSSDGQKLRIDKLDGNTPELDIPVVSGIYVPGKYSLEFKGINSVTKYSCAYLEDVDAGKFIDIMKENSYTFSHEDISKEHKFVLHFSNNAESCTRISSPLQATLNHFTFISTTEEGAYVHFNFTELTDVRISVFNVIGQQVGQTISTEVSTGKVQLDLGEAAQLYFVRIETPTEKITKKAVY